MVAANTAQRGFDPINRVQQDGADAQERWGSTSGARGSATSLAAEAFAAVVEPAATAATKIEAAVADQATVPTAAAAAAGSTTTATAALHNFS